jgi:hypothetical protein
MCVYICLKLTDVFTDLHPGHLQSDSHLHPVPQTHPVAGQESAQLQFPATEEKIHIKVGIYNLTYGLGTDLCLFFVTR